MRLVLLAAPRTKKNSNRILKMGRFNKIVPSEQYLEWRDEVVPQLKAQFRGAPIAYPVNVRATVYRDANRGDLIGYLHIADAMEEAGVLTDDKWIEGWDGSRQTKDGKRPRVELYIQRLEICDVARAYIEATP